MHGLCHRLVLQFWIKFMHGMQYRYVHSIVWVRDLHKLLSRYLPVKLWGFELHGLWYRDVLDSNRRVSIVDLQHVPIGELCSRHRGIILRGLHHRVVLVGRLKQLHELWDRQAARCVAWALTPFRQVLHCRRRA